MSIDKRPTATSKPSESFEYYTETIYWNDFEAVRESFNLAISGHASIEWAPYVKSTYGRFQRSFFINCGNGWVERDLFKIGLIAEAIGVDYSAKTVADAISAASAIGMPACYIAADCNHLNTEDFNVDLVVNHAAMHHVAYINRVTYQLAKMLRAGGRYISFDYVGAHRNQYTAEMWSAMVEFNETLPDKYKAKLDYPHMETMIHTDPTEAIHSELQVEVMQRYFDVEKYVELGGLIAYHVLYQNLALFRERHTREGAATVAKILEADCIFCSKNSNSGLFAFWVAAPKREAFPCMAERQRWQEEEDSRELLASQHSGRYYPMTGMEIMCNHWNSMKCSSDGNLVRSSDTQVLNEQIATAQNRISALERSNSWRLTSPLRAIKDTFF